MVVAAPEDIVGWWDGNAWQRWRPGAEVPAVGGEKYRIVRFGASLRTQIGSAPDDGCELNDSPGIDIDFDEGYGTRPPPAIAVSGRHELFPGYREVLGTTSPVYREAARDVLTGLGIREGEPNVVQVVRADLDGDDVNEVFVVTERLSDPLTLFARAGDYSVLFVRQVIDGTPRTTVVKKSIAVAEEGATPFVEIFRVAAVADLNGDVRMETAIGSRYYEGSGTSVHEIQPNGTLAEIMSVGCGA